MAAARHDRIVDRLKATGVATLADLGSPGLGDEGEDPVEAVRVHRSNGVTAIELNATGFAADRA